MNILQICAAATVILSLATVIKNWRADWMPLLRLAAAVVFAGVLISASSPILSLFERISGTAGISEYTVILQKALGVAVLTATCAQICRECGEGGLAGGVELAGKLEILILSLPLFQKILELAEGLLSLGGAA